MSMRAILREPENTALLRERYAAATPEEIASWTRKWKVSKDAIRQYAADLGLRRARDAARQAYAEGTRATLERAIPWSPPALDRDEEYIAACIAQGGFSVLVRLGDRYVNVVRAEWAA